MYSFDLCCFISLSVAPQPPVFRLVYSLEVLDLHCKKLPCVDVSGFDLFFWPAYHVSGVCDCIYICPDAWKGICVES